MRIAIAPGGSRGDVQPAIALGVALRSRGHHVVFAVPPDFAPWVARLGFPHHPFAIDIQAWLATNAAATQNPISTFRALASLGPKFMNDQFEVTEETARGADMLIGAAAQFAAPSVAEAYRIPYTHVFLQPQMVASAHHPPPPLTPQRLPRAVNRASWRLFQWIGNRIFMPFINRHRRRLSLPPIDDLFAQLHRHPMLIASDAALAPLPPDVPASCTQTGAWIMPEESTLDESVTAFLEPGPAPLYAGFGSMPDRNPARTTRALVDAARAVGRRLVLLRGWAGLGTGVSEPDVLVVDSVPHRLLFPRMAAVVHHGGAGTTAAVSRAGVPQVVVPFILDQYYWGHRIGVLRCGPRPLPKSRLTAASLERALRQALDDAEIAARARVIAAELSSVDGLDRAVTLLESESFFAQCVS